MKERFKFRAWSRMHEVMHYDVEKKFFASVLENDCFIVMQCTGLKDKNGKLIYEEDILKYTDCEGKETIGSLEVDRFNLLTFTNMVNCDFCEEWTDVVKAVFFTGNSTIEIIGNIYENKELLEEQK